MARKQRVKQEQPEAVSSLPSVWLKAVYHVHVFHYRMPKTAAIAALASFIPSPLTVKMAMIASLLQKGDDQKAKQLVAYLPQMEVRIAPPSAAFSFKAFLRYRSVPAVESAGGMDETGSFYPSRPHTREYSLFADDLVIFVGLPENSIKGIAEEALKNIRYLGCKDSLVWCQSLNEVAPEMVEQEATASRFEEGKAGAVVLLADFDKKAKIRDLKEIIPGQRKEEHYQRPVPPFIVPGRITTKGKTRLFIRKQRKEMN